MRKWWILAGVLLGVPIVVIAIAAFNLNAFLEQNRGLIEEQAEAALGREVQIGAIRVGFSDGLSIRVEDVGVGDDPAFSKEDFLSTKAVDVGIQIWPALQGKIEVSRVLLRSPTIRVIQRADGLSIDSLGAGSGKAAEPVAQESSASPAFLVSLLQIEDGRLLYIDESVQPPATFEIGELDVQSSDLSLEKPIDFELSARLLAGSSQNLTGSGRIGPLNVDALPIDAEFRLSPLPLAPLVALPVLASSLPEGLSLVGDGTVDVALSGSTAALDFVLDVDLEGAEVVFGESFQSPKGTPLRLEAKGQRVGDVIRFEDLDLTLASTRLEGQGTVETGGETRADLSFSSSAIDLASVGAADPAATQPEVLRAVTLDTKLRLPAAGPNLKASFRSGGGVVRDAEYENLALDMRFANDRLNVDNLALDAFAGNFRADATYDMKNAARPVFNLKSKVSGMQLSALLASQAPSVANLISGSLEADMGLDGAGSAWEQIRENLSGKGEVQVADGVIRDFNPAGTTMKALMGLPFLAGSKLRSFFDAHPKVFGVEDTPFDLLGGHFVVKDGWVETQDLALDAGEYSLSGSGRYALDNRVDFKTVFAFSDSLSQELLAAEPNLRFLRGRTGRVSVPVAIKGAPPKIMALPDVEAIAAAGGGEALADLLGKALGGKKSKGEQGQAGEADAGADPAAPRAQDVGAELLGRGLGRLLGGGKSDSKD